MENEKIQRGKRIKFLRNTAGATRNELAKHLGASVAALRVWEDGLRGGLSKKGADQLVQAFQSLGIECSIEWLMYGSDDPSKMPKISQKIISLSNLSKSKEDNYADVDLILNFVENLCNSDPEYISLTMADTSMEPIYHQGDVVVGKLCKTEQNISSQLGEPCIITIKDMTICRKLEQGAGKGLFNLVPTNLNAGIYKDVKPLKVARISLIYRAINN